MFEVSYTKLRECSKHLSILMWYFFHKQLSYHDEISEKTTITGSDDSENSY